ncbi:hypothetical protein [Mesonia maritima]|uniref:Uncharacterized protein n=1 Tax=Mesonia maritima TaxID=1793873 RepID=A0ABU1K957_9FLAO|nr:hypothetical protein [Mesonia maritima]MDR6302135.1 hypothetical protein [Mesonia maritima]
MKKITLKMIFTLIVLFSLTDVNAQLSASFYGNDADSKIGIGYDFNEKLWGEIRVYSGPSITNTTAEAVLNYNFIRKEKYQTYVGIGAIANNLNGIIAPIGLRFSPIESLSNFLIHIELQPAYIFDYDDAFLTGFFGIRYKFD